MKWIFDDICKALNILICLNCILSNYHFNWLYSMARISWWSYIWYRPFPSGPLDYYRGCFRYLDGGITICNILQSPMRVQLHSALRFFRPRILIFNCYGQENLLRSQRASERLTLRRLFGSLGGSVL